MKTSTTKQLKAILPNHVLEAINDIKRDGFPPSHISKTYHLIHEGISYPQKYVASLATLYATGTQLMPDQFNAGQSRLILEDLGFTIHATEKNDNIEDNTALKGELIGEIYYYAKAVHEKEILREDAFKALGIKSSSAGMYFDAFKLMLNGKKYQRYINADATDYFLEHILQDYGREGLQLALKAVDGHIKYFNSLGKGHLRSIREIFEKYSNIISEGNNHITGGTYSGASPSFRPNPTKTPIDLTRANTMPDAPLTERDKAFISDIWQTYGMADFSRNNMDAGNIRRALERGFMEYVSGDNASPQCLFRLTMKTREMLLPESEESLLFNEIGGQGGHIEGGTSEAMRQHYKRNPKARAACVMHYGYRCFVCNFNFEDIYGSIGRQYIHVHHENELGLNGGQQYFIDPIKDLKPVCPNCHAMLHQRTPAYEIEELREMLENTKIKPAS